MAFISNLRTRVQKYAAYERTKRELRNLPVDYAIEDLGLYPGDAKAIAAKAVYG